MFSVHVKCTVICVIYLFFTSRCVPVLSYMVFPCNIWYAFQSHELERKVRHLHTHLGFHMVSYSGGNELTNGK